MREPRVLASRIKRFCAIATDRRIERKLHVYYNLTTGGSVVRRQLSSNFLRALIFPPSSWRVIDLSGQTESLIFCVQVLRP